MQSTSQTCKVNVDPFGSLILEEKATDIEFKESGNPVLCAEKWNKVKKSKAALVAVLAVFKLCRKRCCGYHRVFKFYNTSQVRGKGPSRTMGRGILDSLARPPPSIGSMNFHLQLLPIYFNSLYFLCSALISTWAILYSMSVGASTENRFPSELRSAVLVTWTSLTCVTTMQKKFGALARKIEQKHCTNTNCSSINPDRSLFPVSCVNIATEFEGVLHGRIERK